MSCDVVDALFCRFTLKLLVVLYSFPLLLFSANYGDEVVMAALYGRNTELSKGNMNLGQYGVRGRSGTFFFMMRFWSNAVAEQRY